MEGMKLRILSYNIHKGFTSLNRDFVLNQIRAALRASGADVLFLQEVLGHAHDHLSEDELSIQFEYLADEFWSHYAYGKNAVYHEGHHGNAILSRYPITRWSNTALSDGPCEARGVLKARVQIPGLGREVLLANTHLGLTQRGRDHQVGALVEDLRAEAETSWVLVGDFNDWNRRISPRIERELGAEEAFKALHGRYPVTFPSLWPLLSLDRVFLHNINPLTAEVLWRSPWKSLSDHLPLLVEVELGAA